MFSGSLQQLADIVQGVGYGSDVACRGVATDTRVIQPGSLFVAITGPRFDGHNFVEQAAQAGAVAALVERPLSIDFPHVVVKSVQQAFMQLASYWRLQQAAMTVAVTGSCGKTTTRQLLEGVFSAVGDTLASSKSFNNHIGVPHTLLQLDASHQYYVQEIGANHLGEILPLVAAVRPKIAIITNAASAHLEGFGDIAGVARAKGELLSGLVDDGIAILNKDDAYFSYWCGLLDDQRVISFSQVGEADVTARHIELDAEGCPSFLLCCPQGEIAVSLQLVGRHNVSNALATAAAACAAGLPLKAIQTGLQQAKGEAHRLQRHTGIAGSIVIDDSYNANPLSVRSAIELLSHQSGETFLVLGDMLELGELTVSLHHQLGEFAKETGIDRVLCYGEASRATAEAFGEKGCFFSDQKVLLEALVPQLHGQAVVLVKGSLSMCMVEVVAALLVVG